MSLKFTRNRQEDVYNEHEFIPGHETDVQKHVDLAE